MGLSAKKEEESSLLVAPSEVPGACVVVLLLLLAHNVRALNLVCLAERNFLAAAKPQRSCCAVHVVGSRTAHLFTFCIMSSCPYLQQ